MTDFASFSSEVNTLIHRVQLQDQKAFTDLYGLSAPKLFALIKRILNDNQEAEDCLQEVFVKLWSSTNQYTIRGNAWGWLCMVARNTALDKVRKSSKHQERIVEDVSDQLLEAVIGNIDENVDILEQASINRCLSKLNESPRQAILLSYIQGYTHKEIVQVMSSPLGTVKAWIRRGLQELKLCLTS